MVIRFKRRVLLFLVLLLYVVSGYAQFDFQLASSRYQLDSLQKKQLLFELDNLSFFKDNEYAGTVMKGYTLPGLWLHPKLVYLPWSNVKLELGVHALIFSNTYKYPSYAYTGIATWKGNQYQRGAHVLPYFRAQVALKRVNLVFGNLYGGANHRLVEPLYNPELNLTADPEMGFQCLYDIRHFHLDAWVNWQSYIFEQDTHQEAFLVGLAMEAKTKARKNVHGYFPMQLTIQHWGGEQDTIYTNSVKTLANAAVGAGVKWNPLKKRIKEVSVEADALLHYQQSGHLWPYTNGIAFYMQAAVDWHNGIGLTAAYMANHHFSSLYGIPYWGAISTKKEGSYYGNTQIAFGSIEYARSFKHLFTFGAKADAYYFMPKAMYNEEHVSVASEKSFSFSFGVFLRINPQILLKQF